MTHMDLFVLLFLSLMTVSVRRPFVNAKSGDACKTPLNADGLCVAIHSCITILDTLNRYGWDIPDEEKAFIQRSFCGDFNGTKHVCCPNEAIVLNSNGLNLLKNVSCGYFDLPKVARGQEAVLFTFPWMALLKYDNESPFKCGGTLISDRYVLTAAHCVVDTGFPLLMNKNEPSSHDYFNRLEVRLGEHNVSSAEDCQYFGSKLVCAGPVEDVQVEEIIPHPEYRRSNIHHDIALIRLNRSVEFKRHIRPICLPITDTLRTTKPENYFVSGWGYTETGNTSDVLMWAYLPHRNQSDCLTAFRGVTLTSGHICVGGLNLQDSCRGDSGGPLSQVGVYERRLKLIQYGIVSYGLASCGQKNLPATYTNVAHYMPWITDNIKE